MSGQAAASPSKVQTILVEFLYGDSSAFRMASSVGPFIFRGDVYFGTNMAPDFAELSGGARQPSFELTVPLVVGSFIDLVSRGEKHAAVSCRVLEHVDNLEGGTDVSVWFEGFVGKVRRNDKKRAGSVTFEVLQLADELRRTRLGLPISHTCTNTLAQDPCQANTASTTRTDLAIVDIQGSTIILEEFVPPFGSSGHYKRGSVQFDGLSITISDWAATNHTTFEMAELPPSSWLGQTVRVVPGCDKFFETCIGRWFQELRFNGIGIGIPLHNPTIEQALSNDN